MMSKILCIYHGNCADGFGAAWAVRHALGEENVEFHAGVHQDPPPDVSGRDVLLVDFSYKRPVLNEMLPKARSITILDHHKTAYEDLSDISKPPKGNYFKGGEDENAIYENSDPIYAVFDMDRSGAGITWDWFFPGKPRPALINHIEDRDLWRFELANTREIQAAVFSYPYDFYVWDWLMLVADINQLRVEGEAIERKHFKDLDELIKVVTREFEIGGHKVKIANLPYTLTSDAGHKLAQGNPFGGCYWDTPNGRVFSLRSTDDGIDVSEIAKQYGGGGHKNASGFRVPFDHKLCR